ncbi:hemolysin family protein [Desulfobacterota bacterium AH_259_B03_O07]|nr:hemolysin family protein [Desulfobacterota bacterium AH_259_B03_O07]
MSLEIVILIVAICLILQAFFAGSEIAIVSCDKVKMKELAENGSKSAKLVLDSFINIERFVSTSLVGINLSLITSTIVLTFFIENTLGEGGEFYAILILAPLVVIFGQVVPKAVFQKRRNTMVLWSIYPLRFASKIFSPILYMVNIFVNSLLKFIGNTENPFITREELLHAINVGDSKLQSGYREKTIKRIFKFSETEIDEIMIPLIQVGALNEDTPVKEAIKMIKETGHSRIPIYKDRVDNITGMLIAFYLLGANPLEPVKNYSRTPFFVPESKPVDELLDEMKKGRAGMAVVVDEYGGAVGVITLEDILEEVVGEIEDEYDKGIKFWRKISNVEYLLNTKIDIEVINDELRLGLPEGEYETLSGFLLSKVGSIPKVGEKITHKNYNFIVTKASSRFIEEVKLILKKI